MQAAVGVKFLQCCQAELVILACRPGITAAINQDGAGPGLTSNAEQLIRE